HRLDAHAQAWKGRIGLLIAAVTLAQAVIDVGGAEPTGEAPQQVELFHGAGAAGEHSQLGRPRPQTLDDLRQRISPAGLAPFGIRATPAAKHRLLDALRAVDAFVAEAVTVADPGLVDRLVFARNDSHQLAAQDMPEEVGSDGVVRGHQGMGDHLPGPRTEAVRLRDERTDRTQVDDVARKLVMHGLLDVRAHLHLFAPTDHAELLIAGDLLGETDTARAVDAAGHVGCDQGAEVLVGDRSLALVKARQVAPEAHRQILQLALTALIAERTVERMVDQQEFHRRALRTDCAR